MGRRDGFTMLELMIVVALIAILAATAIPSLIGAKIAANESAAAANLRTYASAQQMFRQTDHDDDGVLSYAVPYTLLYSAEVGGRPLSLIDESFAGATQADTAKTGYFYTDITQGSQGPFDKRSMFALCASPALLARTGQSTFIIDSGGAIYMRDLGDNIPVVVWPAQPHEERWLPIGA